MSGATPYPLVHHLAINQLIQEVDSTIGQVSRRPEQSLESSGIVMVEIPWDFIFPHFA